MFCRLPAIFHVQRSFELLQHEKGMFYLRGLLLDVRFREGGDRLLQIVDLNMVEDNDEPGPQSHSARPLSCK